MATARTDLAHWAEDTLRVLKMIEARLVLLGPPFEQLADVLEENGITYRDLGALAAEDAEPLAGPLDVDEDAEEEYTIVGSQEANPMEGCISDDSPFGFALKGHKVGETVTVTAPVGELQFKIIAVENED